MIRNLKYILLFTMHSYILIVFFIRINNLDITLSEIILYKARLQHLLVKSTFFIKNIT